MSDLKRLLVFTGFLVTFITVAVAMGYRDDEPNPWHVEAAVSLLFTAPYLIAVAGAGLATRAAVRARRARRERRATSARAQS
jgi:hypothetical protein